MLSESTGKMGRMEVVGGILDSATSKVLIYKTQTWHEDVSLMPNMTSVYTLVLETGGNGDTNGEVGNHDSLRSFVIY